MSLLTRVRRLLQPSVQLAESAPPSGEIATIQNGRDITRGYVDGLPRLRPEDRLLQAKGDNYEIYEQVRSDYQVAAALHQRRLALVSREWDVLPGGDSRKDKQAAASLKAMLADLGDEPTTAVDNQAAPGAPLLGFDAITDKMAWGLFYGYSVAECLWGRDGAQVVLDRVKVRNRRRFVWAPDGSLRLLTTTKPNGEQLPARKFWTFAVGADHDDDPYGLGLAHWLYWPVLFKRQGLKFWLVYLEKFGMPTGVGWFPTSATPDQQDKLLEAVGAIQTDSGLILPEGMRIELLEAARSGTADYRELCTYMDNIITKVVLGQLMTMEAVGGQYKGEMQHEVRQDLIRADASVLCDSFNLGPARWLTDWNYPGAAYPKLIRRFDEVEDLQARAERDRTIHGLGFRPSLDYIRATYGEGWEENPGMDRGEGGAPRDVALAESTASGDDPPDAIGKLADQLDALGIPLIDGLLAPARKLVMEARDLNEIRDGLLTLYADLPSAELAILLAQAMTLAELLGRMEVKDEG